MQHWGSLEIAETLDELAAPASTALVLWDYAKGLVARAVDREAFVANSANLLGAAREAGVPVFFSQQSDMTFGDVGPGLIRMRMRQMGIKSFAEFQPVNAKGSADGAFVDEVAPRPGDFVFEKFLPSAFTGTSLAWRLRARGIKTLVLAGISLETGVDNTAREAINLGFYAIIARDAVSSTSRKRYDLSMALIEELHDVVDSKDIIATWQKR